MRLSVNDSVLQSIHPGCTENVIQLINIEPTIESPT